MALQELQLPLSVSTTDESPVRVFFNPALSEAVRYDVAVGYFSANWVRDAASGIARFACNGGRARWIVSPELSEEDYAAIKDSANGFDTEKIDRLIVDSFERLFAELRKNTRRALSWLIADRIMEFRVGLPTNKLTGILHAKMGVFGDLAGDTVGFTGSYNLTAAASTNWERLDIFCSWKSEESEARTKAIANDFNAMWEGRDPNLTVYRPQDLALRPFLEETRSTRRPYTLITQERPPITVPSCFLEDGKLRGYQEEAINAWFRNNGRGVFNMATGSGKTVTALALATKLCNHAIAKESRLSIVITVPYRHLADQWAKEAGAFGFETLICYGSSSDWLPRAQKGVLDLVTGVRSYKFFVAVNKTFANVPFQRLLNRIPGTLCLIADEMHNLGAPRMLTKLPQRADFRLGLSATPDRDGDERGTNALKEFFGPELINFDLSKALEYEFLSPYLYFPILVQLTGEEMDAYMALSLDIGQAYARGEAGEDGPSAKLTALLMKRARLVGCATNKLPRLIQLLSERRESRFNIVYCGDAYDGDESHVKKTLRLIGTEAGMRANKFTSAETAVERQRLLQLFAAGDIQTLVAIRCLDEGVDIPRTETAYMLASSTSRRQFIQRRGRILRRAPGKAQATIYDFLAVPNIDNLAHQSPTAFEVERKLVRRELARVNEFAGLATNRGEALRALRGIKQRLNLLDE